MFFCTFVLFITMPKYCTAPNCKNDSANTASGEKKSFYKYPLNDPERLQLWLRNMGREDWTPSCHQYLCHEHFLPSCFTLRWGIRYLNNDAVPTIFNLSENNEKRKGVHRCESRAKRQRLSSTKLQATSEGIATQPNEATSSEGTVNQETENSTVQLYAINVNSSVSGQAVLSATNIADNVGCLQTAVSLPELQGGQETGGGSTVTLFQEGDELTCTSERNENVVFMFEGEEKLDMCAETIITGELTATNEVKQENQDFTVLIPENILVNAEESPVTNSNGELLAYFETIPNVISSATRMSVSPETVLSSSLSSKPIVSTVPIVSKHTSPSAGSLVLTIEKLASGTENVKGEVIEDDSTEGSSEQLQQHCEQNINQSSHKSSLSKEQLEAIVIELQKKVKVLQQRHRRHLDKLLGLETIVAQLRQTNLIHEERLKLLEKAYLETSGGVADGGDTIAIIYEDCKASYLCEQSEMNHKETEVSK